MSVSIEVKNVRGVRVDWSDPRNVYVGRGANRDMYQLELGNPYTITRDVERDRVCDLVKADIDRAMAEKQGNPLWHKLNDLHLAYIAQGELTLWCWCAPLRCHAEEYVRAVELLEAEMNAYFASTR